MGLLGCEAMITWEGKNRGGVTGGVTKWGYKNIEVGLQSGVLWGGE